jgi:hypothetical protein
MMEKTYPTVPRETIEKAQQEMTELIRRENFRLSTELLATRHNLYQELYTAKKEIERLQIELETTRVRSHKLNRAVQTWVEATGGVGDAEGMHGIVEVLNAI